MKECLIVIASFAEGYLDNLLTSIEKNTTDVDYQIQVVDNNRDDKLVKTRVINVCEKHGVPYHVNKEILGYSDSLNTGVSINESTSQYILYMDSDTLVCEGWLSEMINCYDRHKDEGCRLVGPLVQNFNKIYLPEMYNYTKNINELVNKDFKIKSETYLVGVCYLRERSTLNKFKWDKNFTRAYSEDNDFSNQVNFWGYSVWIAGKSLIYHKVNSSHVHMRNEGAVPGDIGLKNRIYLNEKWTTIKKNKNKVTPEKLLEMTLGTYFKK